MSPYSLPPIFLRKLAWIDGPGGGLAMSRTIFNLVRIMMCGLFVFTAMITAQAQFRAGVQGTISDSSGALVPDAKVILQEIETARVQEVTSNEDGFYRIL